MRACVCVACELSLQSTVYTHKNNLQTKISTICNAEAIILYITTNINVCSLMAKLCTVHYRAHS